MPRRDRDSLNPQREEVRIEPDGFSLFEADKLQFSVKWGDVTGIVAFKRDLFTIDEIMIGLRVQSHPDLVCVSENAEGYGAWMAEIESRFPDYDKSWFINVAIPAFVEKWTVIWGNVPSVPECKRCGYDLFHGSGSLICPECGHDNDPAECSACRGRGYFQSYWEIVLGLTLTPAAAFLLDSSAGWLRTIRPLLFILLIVGAVLLLVGIRSCMGTQCPTCRGTGRV